MGTYLWQTTAAAVVDELLDGYQSMGAGKALIDYDLNSLDGKLALYTLNWCEGPPRCGNPECPGGLWIGVDAIYEHGAQAGYKPMDESMGPYAVACPLEWIFEPRLMPARAYAADYRRRVLEFWNRGHRQWRREWNWPGVWPDGQAGHHPHDVCALVHRRADGATVDPWRLQGALLAGGAS